MTTAGQLITAEDLLNMSLDQPCELVAGELRMMSPSGEAHCRVAARLVVLIGVHVEREDLGVTYTAEPGFVLSRDPDTVRAPDVAFVSKERLLKSPEGFIPGAPDLAVEVVSPTDRVKDVAEKAEAWIGAGVRAVWVVWPSTRTITVYRPGAKPETLREQDTLKGGDALPGFEHPVAEVFGQ